MSRPSIFGASRGAFPGHPVVVRTYDLGGDKLPRRSGRRKSSALGWRAIRVCLRSADIFRDSGAGRGCGPEGRRRVAMIPLVTRLDELDRTRALVGKQAAHARPRGHRGRDVAAAGSHGRDAGRRGHADRLAAEADFLSVGTNDLTQYTLAVDRGNARLADRFTPHDPSVLRLLKMVADAARMAGKPASVCGEMASERYRRSC